MKKKGKQFERRVKSDKEAADIEDKGNRKQEMNLRLDNILVQIDESTDSAADIHKLVAEGKRIIKKRKKLIKIADKNKDGWLAVQEYESNDFASDSEDEQKIRKTKAAAENNRKEAKSNSGNTWKSLLVFCSFSVVRPLFICTLRSSRSFWLDCLSIQPSTCIYLSMFFREK